MKYIVIWEQEYDIFNIIDLISEDNFEEFKQDYIKEYINFWYTNRNEKSYITGRPIILERIEDTGRSVLYWELITDEDKVHYANIRNSQTNPRIEKDWNFWMDKNANIISSFGYQVFDDLNSFKNRGGIY